MSSFQINPYIAGTPLRGHKGFLGRQKTISQVEQELLNPGTNALVLFGQRRIGKTSLLLQLQQKLPEEYFLPIYFDLQDYATRSTNQFLNVLIEVLCEKIRIRPPKRPANEDSRVYLQEKILPAVYRKLNNERRVVFLLDEFDVLDQVTEAELPEEAASKSLLPFLRKLMNEEPRLAFVFVAGRRPQDLSLDFNATFKASITIEIWLLDRNSARSLVSLAEENDTLRFSEEAIDTVLSLTSGHPYLIQLLCQRVWERAYQKKPIETPYIDAADVELAITDAIQAGNQALHWLWEGLTTVERIYTAALAEVSKPGYPIKEDQVIQVLYENAARLRTREVELAPRDLVKRRILNEIGGGYCFAVEMFRLWVKENRPLYATKDDLDSINIPAMRLFQAGESFFFQHKWEKAIDAFSQAIDNYPQHFRARLYKGEALLELNRFHAAVEVLSEAYQLDKVEARLPLARALLAYAQQMLNLNTPDEALRYAVKVLDLSPNEVAAQNVRSEALKRLRSRGKRTTRENEYSGELETSSRQDLVYVFTPRGDLVELPTGSTPIDFAYQVHTEIGHRCRGSKVNGHLVPLNYVLETGDTIEILTAKQGGPGREWLSPDLRLAYTQRARKRIRKWFKQQDRAQNILAGKNLLERELLRLGLETNLDQTSSILGFKNIDDFYVSIGNGDISIPRILTQLADLTEIDFEAFLGEPLPAENTENIEGIRVVGLKGLLTSFARCCNPRPGDEIVGYITRGRGVTIHRQDCPNLLHFEERERIIKVSWGLATKTFQVKIIIEAYDRSGLMGDIAHILEEEKINIVDVNLKVSLSIATMQLAIEVGDIVQLSRVLARLENVPNITRAFRAKSEQTSNKKFN